MPIYEYQCRKCKSHLEVFQKVNDKPLSKCRKCGGRLEKVISAPAIQFKGSGWYVTDYGRQGKQTKGEGETAAEDKTTEKKPDQKTKEAPTATKSSTKTSSKAPNRN
ncbi:MAG: transcriptional regulator [Acidobacteria bacterium]|nr:MAG: transcriptional regulator [Acidobacteriota bacterium]